MNRFATLLNDIDARLDLHQPAKGRILLEIAADIEDLFEHHLAGGMDETEAQQAVEEDFAISDEVLADLVDLHQTRYQRFFDQLSDQAQNRWERGSLALLVLLMAISFHTTLFGLSVFLLSGLAWFILYRRYRDLSALRA